MRNTKTHIGKIGRRSQRDFRGEWQWEEGREHLSWSLYVQDGLIEEQFTRMTKRDAAFHMYQIFPGSSHPPKLAGKHWLHSIMGAEAKQLPLESFISLSSAVLFCASALCLNSSCYISQIVSATDLAQGKRGVVWLMALVGQWWQEGLPVCSYPEQLNHFPGRGNLLLNGSNTLWLLIFSIRSQWLLKALTHHSLQLQCSLSCQSPCHSGLNRN